MTASTQSAGNRSLALVEELLAAAGISVNGDRPWDVTIHNPGLAQRVLAQGSLGVGESYMDGDWDSEQLDETIARILKADLASNINPYKLAWHALRARLFNHQTRQRAFEVGKAHYDLGNEFYSAMLDPTMAYTCGYWKDASTLEEAQVAKLDLICRKLDLRPGQRLLDIGCGWGSFMKYAAEHYGVECVGLTVSREQVALGERRCEGLPVTFRLQDYRDEQDSYDHIVSVGMFEHVGPRNYRAFMQTAERCLRPGGLLMLHTIGKLRSQTSPDPWLDRYIFPNGELPAAAQIMQAAEGLFVLEDLHNFGADYDHTLMAWHANFEAAWPRFREQLGDRFYRMWRYYLLSCAGAFRSRTTQLWQFVFSKGGMPGGYRRVS